MGRASSVTARRPARPLRRSRPGGGELGFAAGEAEAVGDQSPLVTIDQELERVRSTPAEVVAVELGRSLAQREGAPPASLRALLADLDPSVRLEGDTLAVGGHGEGPPPSWPATSATAQAPCPSTFPPSATPGCSPPTASATRSSTNALLWPSPSPARPTPSVAGERQGQALTQPPPAAIDPNQPRPRSRAGGSTPPDDLAARPSGQLSRSGRRGQQSRTRDQAHHHVRVPGGRGGPSQSLRSRHAVRASLARVSPVGSVRSTPRVLPSWSSRRATLLWCRWSSSAARRREPLSQ
jgi:hypothetical protein